MVAMVTSRNGASSGDGVRVVIGSHIHPRREGEIAAAAGKEEKGREKRKIKKERKRIGHCWFFFFF